jgi:hypothetical protein
MASAAAAKAKIEALRVRVADSLGDPQFSAAFQRDPLEACRTRFGADAMANEGEYFVLLGDGSYEVVLPQSKVYFKFERPGNEHPQDAELSDEMLEMVSGGSTSYCSQPPPYACNGS